MEQWKPIADFDGRYEVSTYGRVRSVPHEVECFSGKKTIPGRVLKPYKCGSGYLEVSLGRRNKRMVHRLVAEAFIPKTPGKSEVNHRNLNKTDNRVSNLEWVTRGENLQHAHDKGAFPPEAHRRKLLCEEAKQIFPSSYQAAEWVNAERLQYTGTVGHISANIRTAARLGRKAYGFHWTHVDEQPSTTIPKGSTPKRVEMGGSA